MTADALACQDDRRRDKVRETGRNGLDYVEVGDDRQTLCVHFLAKAPERVAVENVRIEGGRRVRGIVVTGVQVHRHPDPELDDCLQVTVDRPGDFSIYTLRLVDLDERGRATDRPMAGFDPRYAAVEFSFAQSCPSELDCAAVDDCPPPALPEPPINYLAKDYESFRRLVLDRLALVMPEWRERHVPDLGVALVELFAYVGDYLSYYQDAVATEAYLDTARQRVSVRRHARLVDYHMHDGCNARAWVWVWTDTDVVLRASELSFLAGSVESVPEGTVLRRDDLPALRTGPVRIFEPLVEDPADPIDLRVAHNRIPFYTWGDARCCLEAGATTATLRDAWVTVPATPPRDGDDAYGGDGDPYRRGTVPDTGPPPYAEQPPYPPEAPVERGRALRLAVGQVLLLQEVLGPKTGSPADADPAHVHPVRLTRVEPGVDELYDVPVVEVEWTAEDALPFPLCLSSIGPAPDRALLQDVSVARGNVVLVDHGATATEVLGPVAAKAVAATCRAEGRPSDPVTVPARFRPVLTKAPLTFSEPLPRRAPAARLLRQDAGRAVPAVALTAGGGGGPRWRARRDLLDSAPDDRHFVVETDDTGRATLRFGDGELGRLPAAGGTFAARYRTGNGPDGNVGAFSIRWAVVAGDPPDGVALKPSNPLPAEGGTAPQALSEVRLLAPRAFRHHQPRAITAEDYARLAETADPERGGGTVDPRVQRARAELRWTGSWYEALVAVDAAGRVEPDARLLDGVRRRLDRGRRMGHDLRVAPARHVPLDVDLEVCVQPDHVRGHVKAALLAVLGNGRLPDGRLGFFHPDRLSFGDGVHLSALVAAAQQVPGVGAVRVTRLERLHEGPNGEIEQGVLPLGPLEVARLDNDPSLPEHGRLVLRLEGGR